MAKYWLRTIPKWHKIINKKMATNGPKIKTNGPKIVGKGSNIMWKVCRNRQKYVVGYLTKAPKAVPAERGVRLLGVR